MTIPGNQAKIDNLKKIAELNAEAGDWVYSPVPDSRSTESATEAILKQVADVKLPKT